MKWEITEKEKLAKEPYFGGMATDSRVMQAGESYSITTGNAIDLSDEDRERLAAGAVVLFAYGFVHYIDFLDEAHQTGMIAKWDPARGFVGLQKENYSYTKSEKRYTKQSPKPG
jgi:hypothetical protein